MGGKILAKARLRIRDQHELLNQIAGTYKDFYRAAMEYVDNAIDAAEAMRQGGVDWKWALTINVDTRERAVTFRDNCGGMSPSELCDLLSEVGRSSRKASPWANGQFGFGVHAFRAFANKITFVSRKKEQEESQITIDRDIGEQTDVACERSTHNMFRKGEGTWVKIFQFDPHVFKKSQMKNGLIAEVEYHFDDVLRSDLFQIQVLQDGRNPHICRWFDYDSMPGTPIKRRVPVRSQGKTGAVDVDLRVLETALNDRPVVVKNKQRRVSPLVDLKSYKNFLRSKDASAQIWSNPFLIGSVEIHDFCSPNITRDDLRDSSEREALYERLFELQAEVERTVQDSLSRRSQESYNRLSQLVSECLARVLNSFRLEFEQQMPTDTAGMLSGSTLISKEGVGWGGEEPGGGAPGPDFSSGGETSGPGSGGPGTGERGRGGERAGLDRVEGTSEYRVQRARGPQVLFQPHPEADRFIELPDAIIVNTAHEDFIKRSRMRDGRIRLDTRLINYVAVIVAPFCVHKIFERRGKVPTPKEVSQNMVSLTMELETGLNERALGFEVAESGDA